MEKLINELYLNLDGSQSFLPFMWPIVTLSLYYFDNPWGALYGTMAYLVGETLNLYQWWYGNYKNKEWASSLPEIFMAEIPGVLTAAATWIVSDTYLFPDYPFISALLGGFMGYEAYIQTCERDSAGPHPKSVITKAPFWLFTLASLAAIYITIY